MRKKVLVIDDDESILEAISFILEDASFTVATSLKGDETYSKIAEFSPDVIILDVLMSGIDGRTICTQLKKQDDTKQIPVIMISAHPSAKETVIQCGANAFLPKPFNTDALLSLVNTV